MNMPWTTLPTPAVATTEWWLWRLPWLLLLTVAQRSAVPAAPDPMANPYLAFSVILAAGLRGI